MGILHNGLLRWCKTNTDQRGGDSLVMPNIPTADPEVVGALWSNSGIVTVSAGA